jgi:hypothetical protein
VLVVICRVICRGHIELIGGMGTEH